jgi:hypothetical protein
MTWPESPNQQISTFQQTVNGSPWRRLELMARAQNRVQMDSV